MPLSFPSTPNLNDTYTSGSVTWKWNGYAWDIEPNEDPTFDDVYATTFHGVLDGNASTASALFSTRTINGINFNGTANVQVPGARISSTAPISPAEGDIWFDTESGKTYVYYDGFWAQFYNNSLDGVSIQLTDLSVTTGSATAGGSLTYNNTNGVFTYRPSNFSLASLSITTASPSGNGSLTYDGNGAFTFTPADASTKAPINSPTFTGTVNGITASMVGLGNVTNESKATMFTSPTFTGLTTLQQSTEVISTINSATGVVTHDYSTGAIWYHTSISGNFTANFTNVPTTENRSIAVTLILEQGVTPRSITAVQIDGVGQTIRWLNASVPSVTATRRDVYGFVLIRQSLSWTVIGSLTSFG